jgi:agmatinase
VRGPWRSGARRLCSRSPSSRWRTETSSTSTRLVDAGDIAVGENVEGNIQAIRETLAAIASRGALPLALGGDHFVTYPAVGGVVAGREAASLGRDLAYVHVDMHLDLADDVPGFGRYASGTPVRRLVEDGVLDPSRILIWGVESFQHTNEWQFAGENGITVVSAAEIEERGAAASAREPLERVLKGADGLYLSVDIDVIARVYAPGTGNAAGVAGLKPGDVLELLRVVREHPLAGVDLVEVAPRWDPTGVTAGIAASLLIELLWPRLFETVE